MIKIAFYGKGGIGKSTIAANVSSVFSHLGYKTMQIGCDPKADSTGLLMHGKQINTILNILKTNNNPKLEEIVNIGYNGVYCVEAGGPTPGMGCAGRGVMMALDKLEELGAYDFYKPDIVIFDVLGDVVCGGFAMPMREGYADKIYIVTSGEKMAMYQSRNIASACEKFSSRNYAKLGGIILNHRDVLNENEKIENLVKELNTKLIGEISHSTDVEIAEEKNMPLIECMSNSKVVDEYTNLAKNILKDAGI